MIDRVSKAAPLATLGIITARGGSKSIPRKNIRLLGGKPLIQYTIDAALSTELLDHIIVSTDDPEIAQISRKLGVNVPFVRPQELSDDTAPTWKVAEHALNELDPHSLKFSSVCILQPTVPFRMPGEIDSAIQLFREKSADTVITVSTVPIEFNPYWTFLENANGELSRSIEGQHIVTRRQDLPTAYFRTGSVYVISRDTISTTKSLFGPSIFGLKVTNDMHVNLDTMKDWEKAEALLENADKNI